jgi:UDP-glucuronate decarboxylase
MEAPDSLTGPVNLGNPVENTILEIAELILAKTGSRSEIAFKPLPADDPKQRQPDISLARSELGWHPAVVLDRGLDDTIAYFAKSIA